MILHAESTMYQGALRNCSAFKQTGMKVRLGVPEDNKDSELGSIKRQVACHGVTTRNLTSDPEVAHGITQLWMR